MLGNLVIIPFPNRKLCLLLSNLCRVFLWNNDPVLFGSQMFQKAGVSKEHLKQKNYGNLQGFDVTLSVEVPDYWIKMQDRQDQGASWGDLLQHLPES